MNLTDEDLDDLRWAAIGSCPGKSAVVKEACAVLSSLGDFAIPDVVIFPGGRTDSPESQACWVRVGLLRPGISDECREVLLQFLAYLSL